MTDSVDNHKETMQRLGAVNATALQLQPFWIQTRTTVKWRFWVFEGSLSTKLRYGLETIQLTKSERNTLGTFQRRCYDEFSEYRAVTLTEDGPINR